MNLLSNKSKLLACVTLSFLVSTCFAYDKELFKSIVYNDHTNDDAIDLDAQELIIRSGFRYEQYYVPAQDGYITQILRLINPLVKKLKHPPVLVFHGANADMASYVMSSSIQHFPEVYPRSEEWGPIKSSNRSLAFTLANNGYDVWLMGSRGSNKGNQAYTDSHRIEEVVQKDENGNEILVGERLYEFSKTHKYWKYDLDDIIKYDLKIQIDKVLKLTGSNEFSVFSFSLSTPTTMAFLAANPDYANRVRVYIQMGPAINASHFTLVDKVYFELLCPFFPTRGIGFTPFYSVKTLVRKLIVKLSKSDKVKYSFIKTFTTTLFGPSEKYQTNLERNVLGHVFEPVSFKSVQHYCQNSVNREFSHFDYGKRRNKKIYGSKTPPKYDISHVDVQNYVIISGTNDALADPRTVNRLIALTKTRKPIEHIIVANYNHLDLLAGTDVDVQVVLPTVNVLDRHSED